MESFHRLKENCFPDVSKLIFQTQDSEQPWEGLARVDIYLSGQFITSILVILGGFLPNQSERGKEGHVETVVFCLLQRLPHPTCKDSRTGMLGSNTYLSVNLSLVIISLSPDLPTKMSALKSFSTDKRSRLKTKYLHSERAGRTPVPKKPVTPLSFLAA